jgi:TP901 family phage tail tape measure protein
MATKKTYTIGFDLMDNFSSKYEALMKKLSKLTDTSHKLKLEADTGALSKLDASTSKVTKAVEKSSLVFGSQKNALDQASEGFRTLADSMDMAEKGHGRLGGALDMLRTKYSSLLNVADDFGDAVSKLAIGDVKGAIGSGKSALGGATELLAGAGISTGALLVGGGAIAAAALTVPGAATWEKMVGRASKTALNEDTGYTSTKLSASMLNAYTDLRGVDQASFTETVGKAGSLGYFNEEAIQAATLGTKAGAAFELDTAEAMKMLGVVNQMWAEQSKLVGGNIVMMEKAGSTVNVLGNKYAATEGNILQFLSSAGGIAKVWKMSVSDTAAVGALLETVNVQASEGETMFRSALNAGLFQTRAVDDTAAKSFRKAGVKKTKGVKGYDIAAQLLGVKSKDFKEMINKDMPDTMLATVDAILEKSGGDSTLAQQLSEAAFGSYGQGFLKLGGQRENLKLMKKDAAKGFEEGTSLNEEYTRQTSNIIDTFDETMKIFGAIGKVVGGYLLPPLAILLGLFNAIISPIAKFGIFMQTMVFNQIDKITKKFTDSNLGKDLGAAWDKFQKTSSKIWEVIGPVIVKLLELMLDVLSGPVLMFLQGLVVAYDVIRPYVLKIADFISLVAEKLTGLWHWLEGAIPGYKKTKAEEKMTNRAEKENLYLGEDKKTWYKLGTNGEKTGITASSAGMSPSEGLKDQWQRWNDLPSFEEGIVKAVKEGLSGAGQTIAEAITSRLPDFNIDWPEFPDFSDLTNAIDNLAAKFGLDNGHVIDATADDGRKFYLGEDGKYWEDIRPGKDKEYSEENLPEEVKPKLVVPKAAEKPTLPSGYRNKNTGEEWDQATYDRFSSADGFDKSEWEKFAVGAEFTRGGRFQGEVHEREEIIPQATAIKGPGPISRALNLLYSLDRPTEKTRVESSKTDVHNQFDIKIDFAGARFDSDVDVEAMLEKMKNGIRAIAVQATRDAIGNRR